ncbi:MAG: ABC transporter substrate-binding protein [Chloroflexi bacterium]|nr:MAG: ABC transporter substrate-binding protein [Chloroflexota bacterium]
MSRSLVLLAVVVLSVACGAPLGSVPGSPTPTPIPVTFMAGFKPQADVPFVAVYVAQEKGYFRAQGLEVTIQHATQSEHIQLLATDRVQFSTGSAPDVLKRVAQSGVPLVAIAQLGQKGEQALAVRADSAIATPKDWEDKLVGYKGTVSADYLAIVKAAGVDRSKVHEVSVGFDPRVLATKQVDVYPVFKSNEPDILAKLGVPVRLFDATDYGIPMLGLSFITNQKTATERPEVVRRFLRAALKGLSDAMADRGMAIDATMKYAVGEDRDHQRFMFDAELRDVTSSDPLGWITRERWAAQERTLQDVGVLAKPVDVAAVVDDSFVRSLYRDGALVWP